MMYTSLPIRHWRLGTQVRAIVLHTTRSESILPLTLLLRMLIELASQTRNRPPQSLTYDVDPEHPRASSLHRSSSGSLLTHEELIAYSR